MEGTVRGSTRRSCSRQIGFLDGSVTEIPTQVCQETRIARVHLQPTARAFGRGMGTKAERVEGQNRGRAWSRHVGAQHDAADGRCHACRAGPQ